MERKVYQVVVRTVVPSSVLSAAPSAQLTVKSMALTIVAERFSVTSHGDLVFSDEDKYGRACPHTSIAASVWEFVQETKPSEEFAQSVPASSLHAA